MLQLSWHEKKLQMRYSKLILHRHDMCWPVASYTCRIGFNSGHSRPQQTNSSDKNGLILLRLSIGDDATVCVMMHFARRLPPTHAQAPCWSWSRCCRSWRRRSAVLRGAPSSIFWKPLVRTRGPLQRRRTTEATGCVFSGAETGRSADSWLGRSLFKPLVALLSSPSSGCGSLRG